MEDTGQDSPVPALMTLADPALFNLTFSANPIAGAPPSFGRFSYSVKADSPMVTALSPLFHWIDDGMGNMALPLHVIMQVLMPPISLGAAPGANLRELVQCNLVEDSLLESVACHLDSLTP